MAEGGDAAGVSDLFAQPLAFDSGKPSVVRNLSSEIGRGMKMIMILISIVMLISILVIILVILMLIRTIIMITIAIATIDAGTAKMAEGGDAAAAGHIQLKAGSHICRQNQKGGLVNLQLIFPRIVLQFVHE